MLPDKDRNFMSRKMKIDLDSIDNKLKEYQVFEFKNELETAISEFIRAIQNRIESDVATDIYSHEDNDAEKCINNYACNLSVKLTNDAAKETLDSLRHAFVSYAFNGLHQLFTRQENEVWYPKIVLDDELEPNDIATLPDDIVIYRGTDYSEFISKRFGQSWTTCKKVAEEFAFRHYVVQPWFVESDRIILKTIYKKRGLPQSWWVIIDGFQPDTAEDRRGGSRWHRGIVACCGTPAPVSSPS